MFKYVMIILLASASSKGCNNEAKNKDNNEVVSESIMEKKSEVNKIIHDIYALKSIEGQEIDISLFSQGVPNLEINLTENKINGFSGCNNYFGEIKNITDSTIELGAIAATKKYCQGVDENTYFQKLNEVNTYKREGLELFLYNQDTLLLTLKKVD